MSQKNALNTTQSPEARRAGMHLVYSRDWSYERRTRPVSQPHLVPRGNPRIRESRTSDTVILTAAALTAPGIWIGHAILRSMHVL
jgi:hypothetical protein